MNQERIEKLALGEDPSTAMKILRGAGATAATAGGLFLGSQLAEAGFDALREQVGGAMAFGRMRRFLDELPEERRDYLLGSQYAPELLKSRFKSLYKLSPSMMGDPAVAVGLLAQSLGSGYGEDAISPEAARSLVQFEQEAKRPRTQPGVLSETVRAITPALVGHVADAYMKGPDQRLEMMEAQHRQKMELDEARHENQLAREQARDQRQQQHQQQMAQGNQEHQRQMSQTNAAHQQMMRTEQYRHQREMQDVAGTYNEMKMQQDAELKLLSEVLKERARETPPLGSGPRGMSDALGLSSHQEQGMRNRALDILGF